MKGKKMSQVSLAFVGDDNRLQVYAKGEGAHNFFCNESSPLFFRQISPDSLFAGVSTKGELIIRAMMAWCKKKSIKIILITVELGVITFDLQRGIARRDWEAWQETILRTTQIPRYENITRQDEED